MKKLITLLLALIFLTVPAFGEMIPENVLVDLLAFQTNAAAGSGSNLAIASTATVYTQSFVLPKKTIFGLEIKATSSGTIDLQVDLEEGNAVPTTEGSSDTKWAIGYAVTGATDISSATTRFYAISPVVARFARFKITGIGSNHASTAISALKLVFSEA